MVIDDDQCVVEVLREVLCTEGFSVIGARSAGAAYDLLHTFIPQLFLIDYWLSGGENGIDIAKWIRRQRQFDAIPIIFLTARDDIPDELKGIKNCLFIAKPFEIISLVTSVHDSLKDI